MKRLTVLVVDDERLARAEIRRHLERFPELEWVGEASNVAEALSFMTTLTPDILVLDVQMPGGSGFDLLESLDQMPMLLFTTAYPQYAAAAFEVDAVDYLVKPIREERFDQAIHKIKTKWKTAQADSVTTLFVREGDRFYFIRSNQITWIESSGNYARIYFDHRKVLIRRSLNQLEQTLPAAQFFRVHRTAIINLNFISQLRSMPDGRLELKLQSGEEFLVSGRQSALLKSRNIS